MHVGQWAVVIGEFALQRNHHSQLTIHNNGFDLSLSFSLVNMLQHILSFQSKAPLENYEGKGNNDLAKANFIVLFYPLVETNGNEFAFV